MLSPRTRPSELICRIDMTAFLSIQVALVFAFIALVNLRPSRSWTIADLPYVAHPLSMRGADREDAIVVAITRHGQIWLGNDQLSLDQLQASIVEAMSHGAERKVYIRADQRARYGWVIKVLATIRSAGIENVAFMAYERQRP